MQRRDAALGRARFEFRWRDQFNLSLDPDTAEQYLDFTSPPKGRRRRISVRCGPKFRRMKITQEVRDFAATQNQSADSFLSADPVAAADVEAGMAKMSEGFREMGSGFYLPAAE